MQAPSGDFLVDLHQHWTGSFTGGAAVVAAQCISKTNRKMLSMQAPGEGLLVDLDERRTGRPTSGAAVAAQWFAQPIFGHADLEDEDEETLPSTSGRQQPKVASAAATAKAVVEPPAPAQIANRKLASKAAAAAQSLPSTMTALSTEALQTSNKAAATLATEAAGVEHEDKAMTSSSDADDSSDDDDSMPDATRLASSALAEPSGNKSGFEEVPVGRQHAASGTASSDESSDDGFSDLDDDGKAEVLALAKKMLRGRDRQDILDGAYHRYAFHESGLPDWFEADERRHMK